MHRFTSIRLVIFCVLLAHQSILLAENYKKLPPAGIEIQDSERTQLAHRIKDLRIRADLLSKSVGEPDKWHPDVEVLIRAVDLAVRFDGFYREKEVMDANDLLDEAERRLEAVARGTRGITLLGFRKDLLDAPQTLIGGFQSRIDDSVQPYGIVLPPGFKINTPGRMDVWLHGRGDTKTEIAFLTERRTKAGQYTPPNTVVLHPFGRHCNAFKFAGETDVQESIKHVTGLIAINPFRIAIRGFSMGGAGCWHLAIHHPNNWFAANPGAGFVDTLVYQGWIESTPFELTPTRKKLLNWYDVLPWVDNLRHLRTVAYSGEIDKQRQAADRVMKQAEKRQVNIDYVIGKNMGHRIDADSAKEIDSLLTKWESETLETPKTEIDFTTYTLRYSKADWIEVVGLEEHWTPGRVQARLLPEQRIEISTTGITGLKLNLQTLNLSAQKSNPQIIIDGQTLAIESAQIDSGLALANKKMNGWEPVISEASTLRKRPGLQGPIDDAFCDRFLFVAPSKSASHDHVDQWIDQEFEYAKHRWETLMRGRVRVVQDNQLTDEMIQNNHLICFGDFTSNEFLNEIQSQLPIRWNRGEIKVQTQQFEPSNHVVTMCYPNPKNQNKYVVINSGMTFREFSNVSNSRQIAMLPDWAIIRTDTDDAGIFAGKIVLDGFFDEGWQLNP